MEQKNLTHIRKLQDPNYYGAYDLIYDWTPDGKALSREVTVTIVKVVQEKLKTEKGDEGAVVYFGECKPMVLNSINRKRATKAIGSPMVEHWIGKKLTLYVERIKAFGEWVDALRVREVTVLPEKPEMTPEHKRWQGCLKAMADGNTTIEAIEKNYRLSKENREILCQKQNSQNNA